MASNSSAVYVPAPDAKTTNALGADIRDIKDLVEIPGGWDWLWWVAAAIALLAGLYLAWKAWLKYRNRPVHIPTIPAHERARRKLQEALDYFDRPKEFCTLVSDAVRLYLEERFDFRAPERTTEEFLNELRDSAILAPRQKQSLAAFLARCDLVKFAKYTPGPPEMQDLYDGALKLINETAPPENAPEVPRTVTSPVASATPSVPSAAPAPEAHHEETSVAAGAEPVTLQDRLIGLIIVVVLGGLGIAMWLKPVLGLVSEADEPGGRGGRRVFLFVRIFEWLWSRPLGAVLILLAAAVLYGVLTRRTREVEA